MSLPPQIARTAYDAAEVEAVHVVHETGATFAALLADDGHALAAVEVEDTPLELLDAQACDALDAADDALAAWLSFELANGAALVIGTYFTIGV